MPLSTNDTSGWFQTQSSAHSAGVRCTGEESQSLATEGLGLASLPPRSGSITTMASPFEAAYRSPSVPACVSSSRKLYWIWQKTHPSYASTISWKTELVSWKEKPREPTVPSWIWASAHSRTPAAARRCQRSALRPWRRYRSTWSVSRRRNCSLKYRVMSSCELMSHDGILVARCTRCRYPSWRALPTMTSLFPPWYG